MSRIVIGIVLAVSAHALAAPADQPWTRHVIDGSSKGADGVRLMDVNGDGLLDVTSGWEQGGVTRAYLHPGHAVVRKPWPAVTVGKTPSVEDAVFVDLDGDGAVDVASSCEGNARQMAVHWAPKDKAKYLDPAAWEMQVIPASKDMMMWMFCLPMDVDGKHGVDLVAGGKGKAAQIGWWEAPADARDLAKWVFHPMTDCGWVMSILSSDMDGDGDADVVISDRHGPLHGCRWLENPGRSDAAALAAPWKSHAIGASETVLFMTLADLDRDGLVDVVCGYKERIVFIRRLDPAGDRWETHAIAMPDNAGGFKAVSVGDVDMDGKPDLVITCEGASGGKWGVFRLSYDKGPTEAKWAVHAISGPDGIKHDLCPLVDMDGDGDLDVMTTEENKPLGVIWYENPAR